MIEALILYLESRDKEAAADGDQGRTFAPGEDIVTEGSLPRYSILVIESLSRRDKQMADGGIAGAGRVVDPHAQIAHWPRDAVCALSTSPLIL